MLTSRGQFEVCRLCWWEDEPLDDETEESAANHGMTLAQARENFRVHGVMYDPAVDPRRGRFDDEQARSIKQALIADFEAYATATPRARRAASVRLVEHDRLLRESLYRSVGIETTRHEMTPGKWRVAVLIAVLLAVGFYTSIAHSAPPIANVLLAAVVLFIALVALVIERLRARRGP